MEKITRGFRNIAMMVGLAAAGLASPQAKAATITTSQTCFSGPTSDATPANYLQGCANVTDYGNNTAQISLSNLSSPAYTLSSFYLDPTGDIGSLTLQGTSPSYVTTVSLDQKADGFNPNYRYLVDFGSGNDGVLSGQSVQLNFVYTGTNVTATDFAPRIAAHFTRGPGDDSAFTQGGAAIPEPGTLTMMGIGAAAMLAGYAKRNKE